MRWHKVLLNDGALGREESATVILEATGVHMKYSTRQAMEPWSGCSGDLAVFSARAPVEGLESRDPPSTSIDSFKKTRGL